MTKLESDPGFFGPESMMWRVNRETFSLFGGARALLMHAVHPLVAAGARQTGGYRRDPWGRLIRTLSLQNLVTFGSRRESLEAADRINKLHRTIKGIDPLTGEWYDALDWEQLLWVHAALEVSTLDFYTLTVGLLTDGELDRYHEENKVAAELLLLPRDVVPQSYADMQAYVESVIASGRLVSSDVAREVHELISTASNVPARIRPLWRFISFAAVGTLDPRIRAVYGLEWSKAKQRVLEANLGLLRLTHPLVPHKFRIILPARWAELRLSHPLPSAPASSTPKP